MQSRGFRQDKFTIAKTPTHDIIKGISVKKYSQKSDKKMIATQKPQKIKKMTPCIQGLLLP